jgi:hypothetical protein
MSVPIIRVRRYQTNTSTLWQTCAIKQGADNGLIETETRLSNTNYVPSGKIIIKLGQVLLAKETCFCIRILLYYIANIQLQRFRLVKQ